MKLRYTSMVALEVVTFLFLQASSTLLHAQSGQMGFSSIITDKRSAGTITLSTVYGIEDVHQQWSMNEWTGYFISIDCGNKQNQVRRIVSNTATTITVSPEFGAAPELGSGYTIRRGYAGGSHRLKLKLYMQYNDAHTSNGTLELSCRIQASDSSAVEFVSVDPGNGSEYSMDPVLL